MATVLLVEDQPINRKLFRDILSIQFEVTEADSAEAARDQLRSLTPDLILMDVQLPGMDGLTFTRELKSVSRTAAIPVVVLSAHNLPRDIESAYEAGCVDFITKPITEDLLAFLERLRKAMYLLEKSR
jgi:two-component system, cell cycle response regulator DivK